MKRNSNPTSQLFVWEGLLQFIRFQHVLIKFEFKSVYTVKGLPALYMCRDCLKWNLSNNV